MGMHTNHVDGEFTNPLVRSGFKLEHLAKTVTAEEALLTTYPPILLLDPNGGAKTVLLPPEADSKGLTFIVRNTADAAETLTVEEDSSTTVIATIAQNGGAILHCDGVSWRKLV